MPDNPISPLQVLNIRLFETLSSQDALQVAGLLHKKSFKRNQIIVSKRDRSNDVYFVLSGRIRMNCFSESGKEAWFNEKGPGEIVGELAAIDGKTRTANVTALCDSSLLHMKRIDFLEVLQDYPNISLALNKELVGNIRTLTERVFEFTAMNVNMRITSELCRIGRTHSDGEDSVLISPSPTHADIASRVSTTREAVTRVFNKLEHDGLVQKLGQQKLTIVSLERLESLITE